MLQHLFSEGSHPHLPPCMAGYALQTLLGKGTRDAMIDWLAGVMEGNKERAKMQVCVCHECAWWVVFSGSMPKKGATRVSVHVPLGMRWRMLGASLDPSLVLCVCVCLMAWDGVHVAPLDTSLVQCVCVCASWHGTACTLHPSDTSLGAAPRAAPQAPLGRASILVRVVYWSVNVKQWLLSRLAHMGACGRVSSSCAFHESQARVPEQAHAHGHMWSREHGDAGTGSLPSRSLA